MTPTILSFPCLDREHEKCPGHCGEAWKGKIMDRIKLKERLWNLDNEVEKLCRQISSATGEAWKAVVEHEDHRVHLETAEQLAQVLLARLRSGQEPRVDET